jgi:Bacterial protein of unknown function (DUF839)
MPRRTAALAASLAAAALTTPVGAAARPPRVSDLGSGVPAANHRAGHPSNVVPAGLALRPLARGSDLLENPAGLFTSFGFLNDGAQQPIEPTKTEPDQNTYGVFPRGLGGPEPGYDYGTHFVFQPHEGTEDRGYVTRVNLDVSDPSHRITLLTTPAPDGTTGLGFLDGSTWDPFTRTLLFTSELGSGKGGVVETSARWSRSAPPTTAPLYGVLGRGGYEGVHADSRGNLYLVEDQGGTKTNVVRGDPSSPKQARQPNSFIYRFIPRDAAHLSAGGELQALQVSVDGVALTFHGDDVAGDVFGAAQADLRDGSYHAARWVTVHDTAIDGFASFDANAAAKGAGATPFKRPENGAFRPGSGFHDYVFDETGDTTTDAGNQPALAARGAWGSLFALRQSPHSNRAKVRLLAAGDAQHSSFDNITWADSSHVVAAEDRGDTLHKQLDTLDSAWVYDVNDPTAPTRLLAEGRDPLAERDAAHIDAATPGFQNEGDNEVSGLSISDGRTSIAGLLGRTLRPRKVRWLFTQQHGANVLWQIVRSPGH